MLSFPWHLAKKEDAGLPYNGNPRGKGQPFSAHKRGLINQLSDHEARVSNAKEI